MLRFAPSPTADMDLDTLRVAILNYLVAKQRNEPFLVRIADTDKARNIEGKDTEFMQILEKFALVHDKVYHQSEHLHIHQTLAIRLLEEGKAFVCTCGQAENDDTPYSGRCINTDPREYATLKESGDPFVVRIKKPQHNIIIHDMHKGDICITPEAVESFIILNEDATPTASFATACDDMLDNISLIIRKDAEYDNTPKEVHVKQMLGYEAQTRYLHLPAMRDEAGREMTDKEAVSLLHLFELGFIPDAIINYLILLSNPNAPQKVFYLPDALEWFSLEDIPASTVTFRMDALRYINQAHLKMMDDKLLSSLFGFADADIGKLAKVYLEEAATINELAAKIRPILAPKSFEGEHAAVMREIQQVLLDAPMFDTFDTLKAYVMRETGLTEEALLTPLSLLLTGSKEHEILERIYPYIRSYLLEVIS